MAAYQTFSDRPGESRSNEKLAKLQLPTSLKGKRILDLGCNEGFFAIEAQRRGAAYTLGIDRDKVAIAAARERTRGLPGIEFRESDLSALPDDQTFDYILVLSVLHYVEDPGGLFRRISSRLAAGGVLILECGVAPGPGRTVRRVLRSIDDRVFPTQDLLTDVWLEGYAVRSIGASVNQDGDPVPRRVFHCSPRKPTVLLIAGAGEIGKTSLASQLADAVVISADALFSPSRAARGKVFIPEMQARYDEATKHAGGLSVRRGWNAMRRDERAREFFTDTIVRAVLACRSAALIVVEGYVLADLVHDIEAALGPDFRCWTLKRGAAPPGGALAAE